MKESKSEKYIYSYICLKIWGCIPLDEIWAKGTIIYNEALEKHLHEK